MKYLFTLLILFLALSVFAQEPPYTPMRLNYQFRGIRVDSLFLIPSYPDTNTANNSTIKNIAGSMIRTGNDFWMRNSTTNAWLQNVNVGAGASPVVQFVDSVWRVSGKDSIFWRKGGVTNKIKDSLGLVKAVDTIYRTAGKDSIFFKIGNNTYKIKDSSGSVYAGDSPDRIDGTATGNVTSNMDSYQLFFTNTKGFSVADAVGINGIFDINMEDIILESNARTYLKGLPIASPTKDTILSTDYTGKIYKQPISSLAGVSLQSVIDYDRTLTNGNLYMGTNSLTIGGNDNIAIGNSSGNGMTGGAVNNVMIGTSAGNGNVSRSGSVFIGRQAGENGKNDNNIMIGYQAGQNDSICGGCVGIGESALKGSTGSNNIAIGQGSLFDNAGFDNVALGSGSGNTNAYDRAILLGHSTTATANDQIVFGGNGNGFQARIDRNFNTDADKLYTFPKAEGHFVVDTANADMVLGSTYIMKSPGVYTITTAAGKDFEVASAADYPGQQLIIVNNDGVDDLNLTGADVYRKGGGTLITQVLSGEMLIAYSDGVNWYGFKP